MTGSRIARAVFVAATLFLVFLAGFASAYFKTFPYAFLSQAFAQGQALAEEPARDAHHLHPVRHHFSGVLTHDPNPSEPADGARPRSEGFILLGSYWRELGWKPGLRLIDRAGRTAHTWNVDVSRVFDPSTFDAPFMQFLRSGFNYPHGAVLVENGDVVFNIDYTGLVRMNASGDVVWKLDRRTHHSCTRADDGNFWVCEARAVGADEAQRRFKVITSPLVEDFALEVSPEGKVLREISVLDVVFNSEHRNRLWTTSRNAAALWEMDLLHMNDVEPLPAGMAESYPLFAAGDLLVSMRNLSMVMVFDPTTSEVKWALKGAVLNQHDPDWLGDGWISIFDNNSDGTPGAEALGGSRIVVARPDTGEIRQVYPPVEGAHPGERAFYSTIGGRCQPLPGRHWLITESTGGRVFEIDSRGRTVWEWAHEPTQDGAMVSEVLDGTLYDIDPALVRQWKAPR